MLDRQVERLYRSFISMVASFRKLEEREVEKIAEGRVWSGEAAVAKGLADEIGTLDDAIDYLQKNLGLTRVKIVYSPRIKRGFLEKRLARLSPAAASIGGGVLASTGATHSCSLDFLQTGGMLELQGRPLLLMPELPHMLGPGC